MEVSVWGVFVEREVSISTGSDIMENPPWSKEWHMLVKTLPCLKLRLRAVIQWLCHVQYCLRTPIFCLVATGTTFLYWYQGRNYYHVNNVENLRELMATFYNRPPFNTNQISNPVYTVPYHDGFGFGKWILQLPLYRWISFPFVLIQLIFPI